MRIGLSIRKWRPEKDLIKGVEHYSFLFVMGCLQVPALSSIKGMWCAENLWFRTTVWFMMILQRAAASSVTRYFQIYWFFIRTAFWKKFYVIHTICFLDFEEFLSNCPCLFLFCDRCNILKYILVYWHVSISTMIKKQVGQIVSTSMPGRPRPCDVCRNSWVSHQCCRLAEGRSY